MIGMFLILLLAREGRDYLFPALQFRSRAPRL